MRPRWRNIYWLPIVTLVASALMLWSIPAFGLDPASRYRARGFEHVAGHTWRQRVPGGWLLVTSGKRPVFLPDPKHEWELTR